jgi:hypothetical protein
MSKIPQQSEVIKAYIEANGHVGKACKVAGIGRNTFYEWKKNDPDFLQRLTEAEEQAEETKLQFALKCITTQIKKESKFRRNGELGMKDNDYLNFLLAEIKLTKKGKQMLGIVPAPTTAETTQTDASGGTERFLGELRKILPNPNIPAPRTNLEDLDHFGNPIKKEGKNE